MTSSALGIYTGNRSSDSARWADGPYAAFSALTFTTSVAPFASDMPCRPVEFPRPIGTEFASTQLDAQLLFCVSRALLAVIEPSQKTQSHKHA